MGNCPVGITSSAELMCEIREAIEWDLKGHVPKSISYSTTPKDQMSALVV